MYYHTINMNEISKKERHLLLKKIIQEQEISDQVQLLDELKKYHIETTQATISRDIQELGAVKVRIRPGMFKYELTEKVPQGLLWDKLRVLFENFVTHIRSTNNLILIKTSPGNANGVAELVDRLERKEILGTIAGDDTVLVITDSIKNRKFVEKEFIFLLETTARE